MMSSKFQWHTYEVLRVGREINVVFSVVSAAASRETNSRVLSDERSAANGTKQLCRWCTFNSRLSIKRFRSKVKYYRCNRRCTITLKSGNVYTLCSRVGMKPLPRGSLFVGIICEFVRGYYNIYVVWRRDQWTRITYLHPWTILL